MKKITLLLFLVFSLCNVGYGQFSENFENGIPSTWHSFTLLNGNPGTTPTWGTSTSVTCQGSQAAYIDRANIGAGNSVQGWLVTPQVTVPANGQLRFFSKQTLSGNQGTTFEVRVSTTSQTDATTFTTVTGANWTEPQMNAVYNVCEEKVVSLNALAGQQVYVAFIKKDTQNAGAVSGDRWSLDNVRIVEECLVPTAGNTTATNVTGTTANLTWTGTASSWEIELIEGANMPGTGTVTNTGTTNPFPVTNLTPSTTYTYYVRANCGDGITSAWAGPFQFTTSQIATPIPYEEGFEANHGWTLSNGTLPNKWAVGTATNNGGTHSLYISNNNGTANAYTTSTTTTVVHAYKDIQLPAVVDEVFFSYQWKCAGESTHDYFRVWIVPASFNPTVNTQITAASGGMQLGANFNQQSSWQTQTHTINASAFAGQVVRLVFEWRNDTSAGTQPPAAIDNINISVITCPAPSNLALSNFTANEATVTWNAPLSVVGNFDYYVSNTNTPPVSTTTPTGNTTSNSITITPLAAQTQYYVWVRTNCDTDGNSFWTGPILINTAEVPAQLDFFDDFEGGNLWTFGNGTQTNKWNYGTATNNGGTHAIYISNDNGTTHNYASSATVVHAYKNFIIPAGTDEFYLTYDWKAQGESTFDYLKVWLVPGDFVPNPGTLITAGAGRTQLNIGTATTGYHNLNSNWTTTTHTVNAAQYAGTVMKVIFEWRNDGSVQNQPPAAVDNVNISIVTCPSPSNLASSNVGFDFATITWTAPTQTPGSYDYYISTTNAAPNPNTDASLIINTTNTTLQLENLQDSSVYYFWVRSNCGADGTSVWVGPISFQTLCGSFDVPFWEGFNSTSPSEHCWTVLNLVGPSDAWDMNYATNPYEGNQVAMIYTDINAGVNDDWLISPAINLTGAQRLKYHYRVQSASEPNDFRVMMSTTGTNPEDFTTTIVPLAQYNNITYIEHIVNLPAVTGPVYIAFHVPQGGLDGWRLYIDNVIVENIPSCPDPTALTVTNTTQDSATLQWTAGYQETQWQVVVQPVGTGAPNNNTSNIILVDSNPYTATGLNHSTTYEYYVRAYCQEDDQSNWVGPFVFNTTQIPAELNFVDGFEGDVNWTFTNGTLTNLWKVGTATNNGGTHALYISNNNGASNLYTTSSATVTHAYRDILIPNSVNELVLSYDWKAQGEGSFDYLNVWLVPSNFTPVAGTQITAAAGRIRFGENHNLQNTWQNEQHIFNGAPYQGQVVRLIFEWRNDASGGTQPPAAVDNVNLIALTCPSPTDLTASTEVGSALVNLTWTPVGTETQWEIIIQESTDAAPTATSTGQIVNTNSFNFTAQNDTFYVFYVRAICSETDTSFWSGPAQFSIFIPPGCASVDVVGVDVDIVDSTIVLCPEMDTSVNLTAEFFGIASTTSYLVEPIEYNPPYPFVGGTVLDVTTDDVYSPVVNLPFNFCFFGESYNEAKVGSNGVVIFGDNMTNGGNNPWSFNQTIPNAGFPVKNAIYGVYQDTYPTTTAGLINYQVLGTYPCRALVVNFFELPQFSCGTSVGLQTSQIVIYEISNIIEVYVGNRSSCNSWNNGNGVIGIQNNAGTQAYTPPGRNTGAWSAQNEAWRFKPNGATNVNLQWFKDEVFFSNDEDITVTLTPEQQATLAENGSLTINMLATATYQTCTPGEDVTVSKNIEILYLSSLPQTNPINIESCSAVGSPSFDLTTNTDYILQGLTFEDYLITYYTSEELAQAGLLSTAIDTPESYTANCNDVVYVRIADHTNTCFIVKSFSLICGELGDAQLNFSYESPVCIGSTTTPMPILANGFNQGGTFSSNDSNISINPTTGAINLANSLPGTYTITYDFPGMGCTEPGTSTATISIIENQPDWQVAVTGNLEICPEDSTVLTVVGSNSIPSGAVYIWTLPDGSTVEGSSITASTYGTYSVIASLYGCTSDPAVVEVVNSNTIWDFTFNGPYEICQDGSTLLTITPTNFQGNENGIVYTWTLPDGSTVIGGSSLMADQIGTYSLMVDILGCQGVQTVNVTENTNAFAVDLTQRCEGSSAWLTVSPVDASFDPSSSSYTWEVAENGIFVAIPVGVIYENDTRVNVSELYSQGQYTLPFTVRVTVRTADGCEAIQSYVVENVSCMIPNGISPNGDSLNDYFDLTGMGVKKLSIYNRYGTEVYSRTNYIKEWNGLDKNGNELPDGTYFYSIEKRDGTSVTGWVYINREY